MPRTARAMRARLAYGVRPHTTTPARLLLTDTGNRNRRDGDQSFAQNLSAPDAFGSSPLRVDERVRKILVLLLRRCPLLAFAKRCASPLRSLSASGLPVHSFFGF